MGNMISEILKGMVITKNHFRWPLPEKIKKKLLFLAAEGLAEAMDPTIEPVLF